MAKAKKQQFNTAKSINKSPYGSHKEFVVDHTKFNLSLDDNSVLCKDESGYYITRKDRLDNGLADPNRWSPNRLQL